MFPGVDRGKIVTVSQYRGGGGGSEGLFSQKHFFLPWSGILSHLLSSDEGIMSQIQFSIL